jgi:hypothetical protein
VRRLEREREILMQATAFFASETLPGVRTPSAVNATGEQATVAAKRGEHDLDLLLGGGLAVVTLVAQQRLLSG